MKAILVATSFLAVSPNAFSETVNFDVDVSGIVHLVANSMRKLVHMCFDVFKLNSHINTTT